MYSPEDKPVPLFNLKTDLGHYYQAEPFLAGFSLGVDKYVGNWAEVPTAGVSLNKKTGRPSLVINNVYMNELTIKQRIGVFKHEFYHILLGHITRRSAEKKKIEPRIWNICLDLAVNSFLQADEMRDDWVIPGKRDFLNYPSGLTAEQYYAMLQRDPNKESILEKFKGISHICFGVDENGNITEFPDGFPPDLLSAAEQEIKKAMREGKRNAINHSWGSIPAQIQKEINDYLDSSVRWQDVVRMLVMGAVRAKKKSTIRKINKRMPYMFPGKKFTHTARIAVLMDQSGSMGDELLSMFFGELDSLAKFVEFDVVPFDVEVETKSLFRWEKNKKVKPFRALAGGTDFNNCSKWAVESGYDACFILTDTGAPVPDSIRIKRIWVVDRANYDHWNNSKSYGPPAGEPIIIVENNLGKNQ